MSPDRRHKKINRQARQARPADQSIDQPDQILQEAARQSEENPLRGRILRKALYIFIGLSVLTGGGYALNSALNKPDEKAARVKVLTDYSKSVDRSFPQFEAAAAGIGAVAVDIFTEGMREEFGIENDQAALNGHLKFLTQDTYVNQITADSACLDPFIPPNNPGSTASYLSDAYLNLASTYKGNGVFANSPVFDLVSYTVHELTHFRAPKILSAQISSTIAELAQDPLYPIIGVKGFYPLIEITPYNKQGAQCLSPVSPEQTRLEEAIADYTKEVLIKRANAKSPTITGGYPAQVQRLLSRVLMGFTPEEIKQVVVMHQNSDLIGFLGLFKSKKGDQRSYSEIFRSINQIIG